MSSQDVAERRVNRLLQHQGSHYLQMRKKKLLTKDDMPKRVTFCNVMKTIYNGDVWTRQVAFYLDGVSFSFKTNPLKVARAPNAKIWRRRGAGLTFGCTPKGSKEGTGSKLVNLFVAITYSEGPG